MFIKPHLLKPFPSGVDVPDHLAFLRRVGILVVSPHLGLEGEEQHLQVALLDELGRLLDVAVGVELAQLLLDTAQRVGELSVTQGLDRLLDPVEEVADEAW